MIEITAARVRLREFRPQEHERFIASRRSAGEGVAVTTFTEEELRARAANSGRMTDRGLLLAIDVDGRAVGERDDWENVKERWTRTS